MDIVERLERLKALRDANVIDETEFLTLKEQALKTAESPHKEPAEAEVAGAETTADSSAPPVNEDPEPSQDAPPPGKVDLLVLRLLTKSDATGGMTLSTIVGRSGLGREQVERRVDELVRNGLLEERSGGRYAVPSGPVMPPSPQNSHDHPATAGQPPLLQPASATVADSSKGAAGRAGEHGLRAARYESGPDRPRPSPSESNWWRRPALLAVSAGVLAVVATASGSLRDAPDSVARLEASDRDCSRAVATAVATTMVVDGAEAVQQCRNLSDLRAAWQSHRDDVVPGINDLFLTVQTACGFQRDQSQASGGPVASATADTSICQAYYDCVEEYDRFFPECRSYIEGEAGDPLDDDNGQDTAPERQTDGGKRRFLTGEITQFTSLNSCPPADPIHDDVRSRELSVEDSEGTVIATGDVGAPRQSKEINYPHGEQTMCRWRYRVRVPYSENYVIRVSGLPSETVTREELERQGRLE